MLLPPATGGAGQAANRSAFIVFDRLSKKEKTGGKLHQRAVFTAVMWENTTLGREFYKTRSKQRPCNSAATPPPTPP